MDGQTDIRVDDRVDGRMDGWIDGWMDGWMDASYSILPLIVFFETRESGGLWVDLEIP